MKKNTVMDSVIRVCRGMKPGETLFGYQFYERTLNDLRKSGSSKRPLSDTVLRELRYVKDDCNIETFQSVSKYKKRVI